MVASYNDKLHSYQLIYMNNNETLIRISVIPKSSKSSLMIDPQGNIKAHLHSPPADGKANDELISLIAQFLHIPKKNIEIVRGAASRHKSLRISGLNLESILTILKDTKQKGRV